MSPFCMRITLILFRGTCYRVSSSCLLVVRERGRVVSVQAKTEFETMKFAEQNNDEEEIPT